MNDPSEPYGEHRQQNAYASRMFADQPPEGPVRHTDLERRTLEGMSDEAAASIAGGAGSEDTVSEVAFSAFVERDRIRQFRPRRDVSLVATDGMFLSLPPRIGV